MKTQLGTMECALAELFDYAGMFPPAQLDLRRVLRDYHEYRRKGHPWVLGCLIVSAPTLNSLVETAPDELRDVRLSVLATSSDLETVQRYLDRNLPIEMIELKVANCEDITRWHERLFAQVPTYVEVPMGGALCEWLEAIGNANMRAKLRMGGVVAEAFPAAEQVVQDLETLAERKIAFKATAGLHHPLRSRHPLTYRPDSPSGIMHGFINLLCASALVWFGGSKDEATQLLEDQDPQAWQVTSPAIRWRNRCWTADQLQEVREQFLVRIGTCSFVEPIRDLEALGWL
jgi:hypothetical protein